MEKLRNVFDDKDEFDKLKGYVLDSIQKFSDYRKGNLTYGEIMFVLECVLDSMRNTSEKEAQNVSIDGLGERIKFTTLVELTSRIVEKLVKKGVLNSSDESYVLHGDE